MLVVVMNWQVELATHDNRGHWDVNLATYSGMLATYEASFQLLPGFLLLLELERPSLPARNGPLTSLRFFG